MNLVIEGDAPAFLDAIRMALAQVRADLPPGCHLNVRIIHGAPTMPLPDVRQDDARRTGAGMRALTDRQRDILDLLATGLSNKEIGRKLGLSHFTVRNHISQIMRLMGVSTRQEIMASMAVHAHRASAEHDHSESGRLGQHDL